MKTQITFTLAALSLIPVSSAIAECTNNMSYNELNDCIVVEGSGENYQEWKAKFDREYLERQQELQQSNTHSLNEQQQINENSNKIAGKF